MKYIPSIVTSKVSRQILITQKHSPRIMFVVGIAGAITSTIMACRATLKLEEALDDLEYEVNGVKNRAFGTDEHYKKDLVYVYAKNAYSITRLYTPAIVVGATSVGLLTGSHVTLTRRNAGLTAAYAATQKAFDDYRDRVKDALGDEKERDIKHALTIADVIGEDGKKTKVQQTDPNNWSMYARFFDEYSTSWQKNAELNRIFVQAQQNYANHILHAQGHLFLNEVYDMLGLPRTKAGQVVGWVTKNGGDNYVDFGMFEAANSNFVNAWEKSVILDFNVDGVIYELIER